MPLREARTPKSSKTPKHEPQVQERGARARRLEARRVRKFKKHKVEIVERSSTTSRKIRGNEQTVHFKYMILGNRLRVGEATTMRHALKRAHQHCKFMEETGGKS